MSRRLATLIVDDEPPARRRLSRLVAGSSDARVVGECRDGREAVAAIREGGVDLVLLDVQMPEVDGFGVIEAVGADRMPPVIFVTAFDRYALDAFEVGAIDYLLKPYDDERFAVALERVARRIREPGNGELAERLACLLEARKLRDGEAVRTTRPLRRFAVRRNGRLHLVPVGTVDWIAAEGAYVRLHCAGRSHLVRDSIKRLESVLDPERFVRIHRSSMVHVDRIVELSPLAHGEYEVLLRDGTRLKLSRSYRDRLATLLDVR